MLTCNCGYDDDGYDWYYTPPDDFTVLDTSRRKRCLSCKKLIDKGAVCLKFERYRHPLTDVEEARYVDEVPLAPGYMCERCGELFFNLDALGFCGLFDEPMEDNLKEYWKLTGFKPKG